MKIGLVCPYSIAYGGGVKEHVFGLRAELARRGHEVYVIMPRPRGYKQEVDEHILFVGTAIDFKSPLHTTVQLSAADDQAINDILDKYNFDILHFHEPWVPILGRQLLMRSQTVNVATFHAMLPNTAMGRTVRKVAIPYTKQVLKYIDEFTAASEGAAEYVSTLTDASISIITNGIDLEVYKEPADFHDHRRHKTILYVGRLEGRKGVNYLIRAFKQLTKDDPNVSLVIAGNGPDREKLESLVEELKADNVSFLGFVSDQQKLELLHSADLFCAPAVYGECFGIVLVEAMASGLVIVAGDNPGYAGVMKGLGALSLVDPHRIEDFARRLKLLLFESALRQLWRDWAREEILQYSYKHITDQYEAVYAKALREASPKS